MPASLPYTRHVPDICTFYRGHVCSCILHLSVISHDLKSPYNTLLGLTEELKTQVDEKNFENVSNYAGIIYQSAEQNLGLLNNLLNKDRKFGWKTRGLFRV